MEPVEDVGNDSEEVINDEDKKDTKDINDGKRQSFAVQSNVGQGREVDSLGTVLSIHKSLYTSGLCMDHSLCAQ